MGKKQGKDMEFVKVPLNEDQIKSFRIDLEKAELTRDKNELAEEELNSFIEQEIPRIKLDEQIEEFEEAIKKGVNKEKVKLSPADILYNKIVLNRLKKTKEVDLPMRETRLQLREFKDSRRKIDSPEMQISKLKKAIRRGFAEEYRPKEGQNKGYMG